MQNVRADLVNYVVTDSSTNTGSRVPTLLKISGSLTLQEAGTQKISSLRIYFPSAISVEDFIDENGFIGCSTGQCTASQGSVEACMDTWVCQNSVQFNSLPSLTENFTLLFPVTLNDKNGLESITIELLLQNG